MTVPNRPTSGAPIETSWGDVVHDTIAAQDLQAGQATATFTGSSPQSDVPTIVFARPFASAPVVVASVGPVGATPYTAVVRTITALQVQLQIRQVDNVNVAASSIPIQWIAYGPRA